MPPHRGVCPSCFTPDFLFHRPFEGNPCFSKKHIIGSPAWLAVGHARLPQQVPASGSEDGHQHKTLNAVQIQGCVVDEAAGSSSDIYNRKE
jgi:hypothetical protein